MAAAAQISSFERIEYLRIRFDGDFAGRGLAALVVSKPRLSAILKFVASTLNLYTKARHIAFTDLLPESYAGAQVQHLVNPNGERFRFPNQARALLIDARRAYSEQPIFICEGLDIGTFGAHARELKKESVARFEFFKFATDDNRDQRSIPRP